MLDTITSEKPQYISISDVSSAFWQVPYVRPVVMSLPLRPLTGEDGGLPALHLA